MNLAQFLQLHLLGWQSLWRNGEVKEQEQVAANLTQFEYLRCNSPCPGGLRVLVTYTIVCVRGP